MVGLYNGWLLFDAVRLSLIGRKFVKMMSPRQEFLAALRDVAIASQALVVKGRSCPVVVGGAAVEFHSGGGIISGDIDITTFDQEEFEKELIDLGWERPEGQQILRGLINRKYLMGIEVVAETPFDEGYERSRLVLADFADDQGGSVKAAILPVEDIIADRVGQYNSAPMGVPEMKDQACALYLLADHIDTDYLDARVRLESCGDFGAGDLKEWARAYFGSHGNPVPIPANAGLRRTESKKALLAILEKERKRKLQSIHKNMRGAAGS